MNTKMYRKQLGCRDMWVSRSQLDSRPGRVTYTSQRRTTRTRVSVTEVTAPCLPRLACEGRARRGSPQSRVFALSPRIRGLA